ncbi:MAG TPA: hypothetical protein DCG34_02790 [Clostridiales bacterium]|nr:hypothetical protein [Clostridiales bacterium]
MVYRISVYAYIATNLATKSMSMNKTQFAADEPNKGVGVPSESWRYYLYASIAMDLHGFLSNILTATRT